MIKQAIWRILWLGAGLSLITAGQLSADQFMDQLLDNLEAEPIEDRAPPRLDSHGEWSTSLIELLADAIPLPETRSQKSALSRDPRIDPALQTLIDVADRKGIGGLEDTAKDLGIPYEDRRVLVTLVAEDYRDRIDLEEAVEDLGGEVTAVFEEVVLARVPAGSLRSLPGLQALEYAAPQAMYYPTYDDVLDLDYLEGREERFDEAASRMDSGTKASEGVKSIGADRLHRAGITGRGVKIGIIDFGYRHYDALQRAGEVPEPAAVRAFNRTGSIESESEHGTGCAEIIHDMAPEAALYLTTIDGAADQIVAAASWLASQGVDIISFSGGGHGDALNGKGLLDRFVEQMAQEKGIAWIVAAGNEGASHWLGRTLDEDGDSWIDINNAALEGEDILLLTAQGPIETVIIANWDDWGGDPRVPRASQDIDMYLFALVGSDVELIGRSEQPQNGRGRPLEGIAAGLPAGQYLLVLAAARIDKPVNLHVVARGLQIQPLRPKGSVATPATSRGALAVGAVDVQSGEGEPYSSRGPTDDGRLKPEVVAPDKTISLVYREQDGRFSGTSAACPHVSGFAALLKQQNPSLSQSDLYREVQRQVRPMGQPIPNHQFGHGHIDASKVASSGGERPPGEGGSSVDTEAEIRDYLNGVLR